MKTRGLLLALATLAYLIIFYLVQSGSTIQLDDSLFSSLNGFAGNVWVGVLSSVTTQFGTEAILGLIGLVFYFALSKEKTNLLIGVLFAIAISDLALSVLKAAYFRPRPYQALAGVILPIGPDEGSSFPSGHATRAFAVFALVTLQKGRKYGVLLIISVAVALSRVILGLHFPSDVLGGAFLGAVLAVVSVMFLSRYVFPRIPASPSPRKSGEDMN